MRRGNVRNSYKERARRGNARNSSEKRARQSNARNSSEKRARRNKARDVRKMEYIRRAENMIFCRTRHLQLFQITKEENHI